MLEAPRDLDGGFTEILPQDVGVEALLGNGLACVVPTPDTSTFALGDIVSPDDRGNVGEVISLDERGVGVRLIDKHDGRTADRFFSPAVLELIRRKPVLRALILLSFGALLGLPAARWLIRHVLRRGELSVLFGPSGCGKTFVALDMALRIALGLDWWGHAVAPGVVVYVAGEGLYSIRERAKAWIQQFDDPDKYRELLDRNFQVLGDAVSFLDVDAFERLIKVVSDMPEKPALIVVDTLARSMAGGDENSAKDMGLFVQACDRLRTISGATVLLVHHAGKENQRSERGSSALRGAADTMLVVSKEERVIRVECDKQKEGEAFASLNFELDVVEVGIEPDGTSRHSARLKASTTIALPFGRWGKQKEDESDCGSKIEMALAEGFFETGASATELRAVSELKKSTYYRHRKRLVDAGVVERFRHKGHDRYRLTPKSKHYRVPVPVPSVPRDSDGTEVPSPSPTSPPPLKGAGRDGTGTKRGEDSDA